MANQNTDRPRKPRNKKEEDMMQELREAVLKNDIQKIQAIIKNNEYLLDYIYPRETRGILLLACSTDGVSAETVSTLLNLGANPREYTECDGWNALHWAAHKTNYDTLNILLERNPKITDAVDLYDENALHTLIRYGNIESPVFPKCIELLLQKGVDVNHTNADNRSPVFWAKRKNLDANLIELMENQVREITIEGNEGLILLNYLKEEDTEKFVNFNDGNINKWANYKEDSYTLLQMCCLKGLTQAAIHLLENGADYKGTSPQNPTTPIVMAAQRTDKETFKVFLDKYTDILTIPQELLPTIMLYIDSEFHDNLECYQIFIEKLKEKKDTHPDEVAFKLNEGDFTGNTALYYAVVYAEPDVVEELLGLGASLGAKNKRGVMPINNIEKEVLKNHLDKCVEFDLKERKTQKENFTVTFNYRTLIPPFVHLNDSTIKFDPDIESSTIERKVDKKLVAETQVLEYMSKSSELKELLTHPTITSYLYLKWLRLKWIFWINLICYVTFASSLLAYIFIEVLTEKSPLHNTVINILQIIFTIGSLAILIRELFQIIIEPKKYFMNVENYVELSLMAMSAIIAYDIVFKNNTKTGLFAVVILLVAFELILLLGQHPSFSTNVVMFRTVSYNYFKFFVWYSLPIIAFAVSFSMVFSRNLHNDKIGSSDNNITNCSTGVKDDEKDPFDHLAGSMFKTMIMLTGEFDSGSLKFDAFPVTSKIIFAAFVFTIAIILLNLLNGLAVNDIQLIQNDAELIGYISRIEFIAGIESMLIGNISIVKYTQKIFDKFLALPIPRDWENRLGQYLSPISCIFPKYFQYEVIFYPRKGGLIKATRSNISKFLNLHLDRNTVLRTNAIIQDKKNDEMNSQDNPIKKLEDQQELLAGKIDTILKLVSRTGDE